MQISESIYGVFASKREVNVALFGAPKSIALTTLKNDAISLGDWLATLPEGSTLGMVGIGGYERTLADLACARGFRVYLLGRKRLGHFAKVCDPRGKLDPMGPVMIAHFVADGHDRLPRYEPTPPEIERQRELQRMHRETVARYEEMRLESERNPLATSHPKVQAALDALRDLAESLEREIRG